MPRFTRLSTCSILALTVASVPAFAELTAEEVWSGMEGVMQNFGYAVSATETPTANGLDVTGVTMGLSMQEENSTVTVSMEKISFIENADGSVQVLFPASMPIKVDAAPEGEDDVSLVIDYNNTGLNVVVSGDGANKLYTYGADSLSMSLADLAINGTPIGRDVGRFDMSMTNVGGTATIAEATMTEITQDMSVADLSYDFAFNDPETGDPVLVNGSMESLRLVSSSSLPEGFDASDPQSLTRGFAADGTLSYANGEMEFAASSGPDSTSGSTRSGTVTLRFAMTGEKMEYAVAGTDQSLTSTSSEFPFPVTVGTSESLFNIVAPIAAAEEPQDMAFEMKVRGFEMSDVVWNLFDPGAALPRDPATIILDLTGQVTPFINMFDPAAVAQLDATGGVPGELNALTLNDLTFEVAGAKLSGTGTFSFDNSDLQTFGGFPRPEGGLNLSLDGANGLIDKLITMGLLTNEDAMGARMMMSMFAVPGDGQDKLNSSIEINEQGHVLANGMRIQ